MAGVIAVYIQVYIMPWRFTGYCIAALIWIYGIFSNKLDMVFIEWYHFRRQTKNSQPVNALVPEKSPGKAIIYTGYE
jgi:hypothetical protein